MKGIKLEKRNENCPVCFNEGGGYSVREITAEEDFIKTYRLRHEVFCEELGWVSKNPGGVERDGYDAQAVAFGVFDRQNNLVTYLRLLKAEGQFMIEREFASMVSSDHMIRHAPDTAEISRLCISFGARRDAVETDFGRYSTSVVILKGIYHWCKRNNVRYLYAVTEYKVYRLACAKGFPFKLIGEPLNMPDGVVAVAMLLDWEEFEFINIVKRPRLIQWFTQYQSAPSGTQLPQHASCSPHPAFALASQHGN